MFHEHRVIRWAWYTSNIRQLILPGPVKFFIASIIFVKKPSFELVWFCPSKSFMICPPNLSSFSDTFYVCNKMKICMSNRFINNFTCIHIEFKSILLPVMLLMASDWPMNINTPTKRQMRCAFPLILVLTNDPHVLYVKYPMGFA